MLLHPWSDFLTVYIFNSNLIQCFTTPELMRWPGIEAMYGEGLRQTKVFGPKGVPGIAGDIEESDSLGEKRWEVLHDRVVEHVRFSFCYCSPFVQSPYSFLRLCNRTSAPSLNTTLESPFLASPRFSTSPPPEQKSSFPVSSLPKPYTPRLIVQQD